MSTACAVGIGEGMDITPSVGRVFNEMGVTQFTGGHLAVALIGYCAELQFWVFDFKNVGELVVEIKPSCRNIHLGACFATAVILVVARKDAEDFELRIALEVLTLSFSDDLKYFGVAHADAGRIAFAVDLGEIFGVFFKILFCAEMCVVG